MKRKSGKSIPNVAASLILAGLSFIYCGMLYWLKYKAHGAPLRSFRLDYIGNLFNLFIPVLIALGLSIQFIIRKYFDRKKIIFLLVLSGISLVLLTGVFFVDNSVQQDSAGYFLNIPFRKLMAGALFLSSTFIQIFILIFVWGIYWSNEQLFIVRGFVIAVTGLVLLAVFSFVYVSKGGNRKVNTDSEKFEYGVVLGAAVWSKDKPSPIFEGRIRKAFELYRTGIIKKISLTGGNAPGELSEAEAASRFLIKLGAKKSDIYIESKTSTTFEQIKFIRINLIPKLDKKKLVIISDDFHLSRILEMCKFFKVQAVGVSSSHILSWEKALFYRLRESVALLLFWFFAI